MKSLLLSGLFSLVGLSAFAAAPAKADCSKADACCADCKTCCKDGCETCCGAPKACCK